MTCLEIILIVVLWIILGLFICSKRDYYKKEVEDNEGLFFMNFIAIIFAPINFLITFLKVYFINDWDN